MTDWLAKLFTRWNKNVYEPEFRILLVVPQFFTAGIGLYGFGLSMANNDAPAVAAVFFGFVTFALIMGACATGTYVVSLMCHYLDCGYLTISGGCLPKFGD